MRTHLPSAVFHLRLADDSGQIDWADKTYDDLFVNKKIVLFAVPGAFTPTCSNAHLPGYEVYYNAFVEQGIDAVYCLSVNDGFIMNEWARAQGIEHVQMLADGNGDFSRLMGMLVQRTTQGLGMRSWRYSLYAENGEIKKLFEEPGRQDNPNGVPMTVSSAENMLEYLKNNT